MGRLWAKSVALDSMECCCLLDRLRLAVVGATYSLYLGCNEEMPFKLIKSLPPQVDAQRLHDETTLCLQNVLLYGE